MNVQSDKISHNLSIRLKVILAPWKYIVSLETYSPKFQEGKRQRKEQSNRKPLHVKTKLGGFTFPQGDRLI